MSRRNAMNYKMEKYNSSSNIPKKYVLEEDEEAVDSIEEIKVINNHIYFYSDISTYSILNLYITIKLDVHH